MKEIDERRGRENKGKESLSEGEEKKCPSCPSRDRKKKGMSNNYRKIEKQ
jgi:hypothetical protein